MTIVKNHKEYKIGGTTYFVERYADKPYFVWFWRYGYIVDERSITARTIRSGLLTRPNLKRLQFV